jgi:hypothetical protein
MFVAKQHLYEEERGEPVRLALPAGSEVTPEQMDALGLKESDKRLAKVRADQYNDWLLDHGYISESQIPTPGA